MSYHIIGNCSPAVYKEDHRKTYPLESSILTGIYQSNLLQVHKPTQIMQYFCIAVKPYSIPKYHWHQAGRQ